MAAVLFYLKASWEKVQGTAGTSLPCSWLAPGSKRKGQRLAETDFTSPLTKLKSGKKTLSSAPDPLPGPSEEEMAGFLEQLQTVCPTAAILKIAPGFAEAVPEIPLPSDMMQLFDGKLVGQPIAELRKVACEVIESLTCSKEEQANAQQLTLKQAQCAEWFR